MNLTTLKANTADARQLFEAIDQIHLASIDPDGRVRGRDFGRDAEAAIRWAEAENGKGCNIYWTVNSVRSGVNKKPAKGDITAARFAHVDIDPPKDGSEWDRSEALAALQALALQPSMIINSGNGVQAFWRLDGGVKPHEIEGINLALVEMLGGDRGTQNADRLMRVCGFVNHPSADKRAKGRVPVLSSLLLPDNGEVFTLAELGAAFALRPSVEARRKPQGPKGDGPSPIERFNAEHSISALLAKYGYTRKGNSDDYHSVYQSSGSFATRDFGDHWVSWSGSDSQAGLGRATDGGCCFGDAFDLFVHYEHGGDADSALSAIGAGKRDNSAALAAADA